MDMAYDFSRHTSPSSTTDWIKRWATQQFGAGVADKTVDILNRYGRLTARRKYELLSETPFAFSTTNYDEARNNLAQWEDLLNTAQIAYDSLDKATQTSFFQLVLHPVLAGKTMFDLYTKVAVNKLYAEQGRVTANFVADQANALFRQDAEITKRYHSLNNGKWDGFVNQQHIGYDNWQEPVDNIMPKLLYPSANQGPETIGVGIQGSTASYPRNKSLTLLAMESHMPPTEVRSFDVFALQNGSFAYTIDSGNTSYVRLSNTAGTLRAPGNQAEERIVITVDWPKAPTGHSSTTLTVRSADNSTLATLILPLHKPSIPSSFKGHVESNGVVAIEASHFSASESKNGVSYVEIPNYGRTLSAMKPWPLTMATQSPATGPALTYTIYTTTPSTTKAKLNFMFSATHNHDPTRPLAFAYSFDNSAPVTVKYAKGEPIYRESQAWRKAVVENGWTASVGVEGEVKSGQHEVRIWMLEPGVVVQKLGVDLGVGGWRDSALGPLESRRM